MCSRNGLAVLLLGVLVSGQALAEWTTTLDRGPGRDPKHGNAMHYLWIPDGLKAVRGIFLSQQTMFEAGIMKNAEVRAACAEKGLAVAYCQAGIGLDFLNGVGDKNLEGILAEFAKESKHPEVEFAPMITLGHSTGGIFCRNVAYWKPERVAGVVHVMSGNLQAHIGDYTRSLVGVPILFINGEWEQYGPDGGDLKGGLHSDMGLRTQGAQQQSQTQWLIMRQQIIGRRTKNPDNVMGLIASRNHSHTQWEGAMFGMVAQFIRSVANLRIPKEDPDGKTVMKCRPAKASDGWLLDADIKAPKFEPAAYADFKGNKTLALWYPDKAMALRVWEYNQQGWKDPDPTAEWPVEKRFCPEPRLQDLVDSPEPKKLTWTGGDGTWGAEKAAWTDGAKAVAWDPTEQAVFAGKGVVVRAEAKVVCSGLRLGSGYTLAIGTNAVDSRWFVFLEEGCTLEVTLDPKEANGRWGARVWAAGNAAIAGTLVLKGADLKEGTYNVVRASGKTTGAFAKVVPPEGWTVEGTGGAIKLVKAGAAK